MATDTSSGLGFLPANGFDTSLAVVSTQAFFVVIDASQLGAAQLRYSSYISGTNGQTWATGVAVTGTGQAYVVGLTSTTTGFPLKNALQGTYVGGNRDAFVMKIDTTRTGTDSLVYSTYLAGDQADYAFDVAADHLGRAVVVGYTFSTSPQVVSKFPLVNPVTSCPTFVRLTPFVTVLSAAGTAIDFSTCYAASYTFYGVATGSAGEIWAVGSTNDDSTNPPTPGGVPMVNAEQGTYGRDFPGTGGNDDALIVRISPSTDLVLAKTATPNPVLPGGTLTYTLVVSNAGSEAAGSVVVTDTLPSSLTFTSCAATNGGVCGGSGNVRTISYGTLVSGASSTVTLVASVNANVGAGATISNTASVTSGTSDSNTGQQFGDRAGVHAHAHAERRRRRRRAHQRVRDALRPQPVLRWTRATDRTTIPMQTDGPTSRNNRTAHIPAGSSSRTSPKAQRARSSTRGSPSPIRPERRRWC